MIWFLGAVAIGLYLLVKWTLLGIWYLALGIGWLGLAAFRLLTNRWPDGSRA